MNEEIIEKIKKLLSLATSENRNEAELASKKAQELLIKYNLSLSEVEVNEYVEQQLEKTKDSANLYVNDIVRKYFFVDIFKSGNKYVLTATPENLEMGLFVRSFLINAFKNLYKNESKKQTWKSGANRKDFYFGLHKGLKDQLDENKNKIDVDNKLIIVNTKLTNYVNSKHKLKTKSAPQRTMNADALNLGYEQGKQLRISKGLEQKNNNTKVFLK